MTCDKPTPEDISMVHITSNEQRKNTLPAPPSLDELFARDPLKLSKPEGSAARAEIISAIRAHDALVQQRLAAGKAMPRRKRSSRAAPAPREEGTPEDKPESA